MTLGKRLEGGNVCVMGVGVVGKWVQAEETVNAKAQSRGIFGKEVGWLEGSEIRLDR